MTAMKSRPAIFRQTLFVLVLMTLGSWARAQELMEMTYEGDSTEQNVNTARQEIFKKAIEETSLKLVTEIVGEQKSARHRNLIRGKIIRNSGKYISFMKEGGEQPTTGGGHRMQVVLKVSLKSLRDLLQQEGLLYQVEGPAGVLPMISFQDRVNARGISWWNVSDPLPKDLRLLADMEMGLSQALKDGFRKDGFYGMSPLSWGLGHHVPEIFKTESLRSEDYLLIGELFHSPIVIRGTFRIVPHSTVSEIYVFDIKLEALHASNGRVIGEIARTYETERGIFGAVVPKKFEQVKSSLAEDLSAQLLEAWKRGTFGSRLIKLSVRGGLTPQQLAKLKEELILKAQDIKSLRERLFEPDQVTFEVDSVSGAQGLADKLRAARFDKFKVEVTDVRSEALALNVKAW